MILTYGAYLMESGTSTGLFILVGIVIFGLFLLIVGIFFSDSITGMINQSTGTVDTAVSANLAKASLTNIAGA